MDRTVLMEAIARQARREVTLMCDASPQASASDRWVAMCDATSRRQPNGRGAATASLALGKGPTPQKALQALAEVLS